MNVLVVYAHPNPDSFTHAILDHVTRGLDDSPHNYKVTDLYASGFDPVFTLQDGVQFMHESVPDELLEKVNLTSSTRTAWPRISSRAFRRQRKAASGVWRHRWHRNRGEAATSHVGTEDPHPPTPTG